MEKEAFEPDLSWLDEALGPKSNPPENSDDIDQYLNGALGPDGWLTAELKAELTSEEVSEPEPDAAVIYTTREEWLQRAITEMSPWYTACGYPLPANVRVSCGWPGTGKRSKRIGECWSRESSGDGTVEIFVSPVLAEPTRVLDVLAHELVHAAVGIEHKHNKVFKQTAVGIGLAGKMTATTASAELKARLAMICHTTLGQYPHAELSAATTTSGPPKQTARLVKVGCPTCEVVARMTRKWIEADMLPRCQCGARWVTL